MARIEIDNRIEGAVDLEEGEIFEAEVTLTAVQMRALGTTVQELVPAPGAGKGLFARWYSVEMLGATAFGGIAAGEDLHVRITNNSGDDLGGMETIGFLDQTTKPTKTRVARIITPKPNTNLVLGNAGAITGGSPCKIKIAYSVWATA